MGLMAAPSTDTMLPCLGSDKVGLFLVQPCLLVCTLHSSHVRIPLHVVKTFDLGLMAAQTGESCRELVGPREMCFGMDVPIISGV